MAEVNPPLFVPVSAFYGADELGLAYRDLMGEGVVGQAAGELLVTQRGAGANWSVDIAKGHCWVKGDTDADLQPTYRCYNDAVRNLAITPADATNPRKTIVIAEVLDTGFGAGSNQWRFRAIDGVPAGAPAEPALPANAIKLAVLTVPAAVGTIVNGYIADTRTSALVGGGAAKARGGASYVTTGAFAALTPADGDEVYLIVDATNGIIWHLRYNAGSASAYKWEFLGGPPMISEVATSESLPADATATYRALTTAGPSITLPRAGDYDVRIEARIQGAWQVSTGNASVTRMSYDIGGTGAVDADSIDVFESSSGPAVHDSRARRKTGLTAVTLTAKYSHDAIANGAGGTFSNRTMEVRPVRIS